ncbi:DUF6415 family natural product biosynthesis protein [Streptomyces ardesiacus]|uniref:DUF6415 family natural product biosynthesis protein n=1 Tax=Streptomyces ardesiacus TaxID=285564 RepID=UPI00368E8DA3
MSLTGLGRVLGVLRPATATISTRSVVVSARETVALVLNEDSPVPEGDRDVDDLMLRLRGHLMQLGPATPDRQSSLATLKAAQAFAGKEVPDDYLQARSGTSAEAGPGGTGADHGDASGGRRV